MAEGRRLTSARMLKVGLPFQRNGITKAQEEKAGASHAKEKKKGSDRGFYCHAAPGGTRTLRISQRLEEKGRSIDRRRLPRKKRKEKAR